MMTNAAYSAIQFNCSMAVASRTSGLWDIIYDTRNRAGGWTLCTGNATRPYNNVSLLLFRHYIGAAVVDARLVMRKLSSRLARTSSCHRNLCTRRLVCRDASANCAAYGAVAVTVCRATIFTVEKYYVTTLTRR